MPRLFILSGPDIGKTYSFDGEVCLGRTSDCEVVVRDASVSRVHAKLSPGGDAWVLEDLDSSNGIQLGSVRAKRFELSDGDVFKLGKIELRFRGDGVATPEEAPVEATPAPQPAPAPVEPPSAQGQPVDEEDGELFLEEDIDLGSSETHQAPASVAPPESVKAPAPELSLGVGGGAPRSKMSDERREDLQSAARRRTAEVTDRREREVLQFSTHRSEATAMTSDLSQHPVWVRAVVFLLVLGVSASLFWLAFRGTSSLRGENGIELDPGVELEDEY